MLHLHLHFALNSTISKFSACTRCLPVSFVNSKQKKSNVLDCVYVIERDRETARFPVSSNTFHYIQFQQFHVTECIKACRSLFVLLSYSFCFVFYHKYVWFCFVSVSFFFYSLKFPKSDISMAFIYWRVSIFVEENWCFYVDLHINRIAGAQIMTNEKKKKINDFQTITQTNYMNIASSVSNRVKIDWMENGMFVSNVYIWWWQGLFSFEFL